MGYDSIILIGFTKMLSLLDSKFFWNGIFLMVTVLQHRTVIEMFQLTFHSRILVIVHNFYKSYIVFQNSKNTFITFLFCAIPKKETVHHWTAQDNLKGRRELKGPRRPARDGQLTLFRESRPILPTTANSLPFLLPTIFQTNASRDFYWGLSIGRSRRHKPAFGRTTAPLPAA